MVIEIVPLGVGIMNCGMTLCGHGSQSECSKQGRGVRDRMTNGPRTELSDTSRGEMIGSESENAWARDLAVSTGDSEICVCESSFRTIPSKTACCQGTWRASHPLAWPVRSGLRPTNVADFSRAIREHSHIRAMHRTASPPTSEKPAKIHSGDGTHGPLGRSAREGVLVHSFQRSGLRATEATTIRPSVRPSVGPGRSDGGSSRREGQWASECQCNAHDAASMH
jgi:hypothetical protein